jgi:hypothetical protein
VQVVSDVLTIHNGHDQADPLDSFAAAVDLSRRLDIGREGRLDIGREGA